jgi:hypothetical protein
VQVNPPTRQVSVDVSSVSRARQVPSAPDYSSGYGPLSAKEHDMIQRATGMEFNWPPTADDHFPMAAVEIALSHVREAAQGLPTKDITATGLSDLHRLGLIDGDFLSKSLAILRQGEGQGGSAKPTSGTVASDGSVYL